MVVFDLRIVVDDGHFAHAEAVLHDFPFFDCQAVDEATIRMVRAVGPCDMLPVLVHQQVIVGKPNLGELFAKLLG